jgi:hypothetical protein
MPAYTVVSVQDQVRDWKTGKGVPWKSYRVTLRNEHGAEKPNVEVSRPATEPAPAPNEVIEGTVENREQYGPKLNTPRRGAGGGGGFRSKPPEERRSIAMQHAQKCAVSILQTSGDPAMTVDGRISVESVMEIAKQLFDQVQKAEAGQ